MFIDREMDKDVVHIYNGILFSHKNERSNAVCSHMDGPRDDHTMWSEQDRERQISYEIAWMQNLKKKKDTNEFIYKIEMDSQSSKKPYNSQRRNVGGRNKLGVWY